MSYSINLIFYILLKINGKLVKSHPVIEKLLFLRELLKKLKPIEKKMEYQINKLLRLSFSKKKKN